MARERDDGETQAQTYTSTLQEVIETFASCGCSAGITIASPSKAVLVINGDTSFCPLGTFEENERKAKELMQTLHPEITFSIENAP